MFKKKSVSKIIDGTKNLEQMDLDPLIREAVFVIFSNNQASVSIIQRHLGLKYSRASKIIDQLERLGVVGPFEGGRSRQLILNEADALKTINNAITANPDINSIQALKTSFSSIVNDKSINNTERLERIKEMRARTSEDVCAKLPGASELDTILLQDTITKEFIHSLAGDHNNILFGSRAETDNIYNPLTDEVILARLDALGEPYKSEFYRIQEHRKANYSEDDPLSLKQHALLDLDSMEKSAAYRSNS